MIMKRTTALRFGIGVMAVLFFTACKREDSINIDQNRIYSSYEYEFDADQNRTRVNATFRLDNSGGKKLQLSYPARVDFNGEGLAWRGAFGSYQLTTYTNSGGGSFSYTDHNNKVYTNAVSQMHATELPFGLTSISQNGNFFLPWQGAALQPGETIRVKITAGSTREFTTSASGATHIILNQNALQGLTPGNGTIVLEREKISGLQQSNLSGGRITSRYVSQKAYITITN